MSEYLNNPQTHQTQQIHVMLDYDNIMITDETYCQISVHIILVKFSNILIFMMFDSKNRFYYKLTSYEHHKMLFKCIIDGHIKYISNNRGNSIVLIGNNELFKQFDKHLGLICINQSTNDIMSELQNNLISINAIPKIKQNLKSMIETTENMVEMLGPNYVDTFLQSCVIVIDKFLDQSNYPESEFHIPLLK